MEQSSRKNSTAWKAAKANHTQKSSPLPAAPAGPLPAFLQQPAPASLPWPSRCSKLLGGSETFFDHHHLKPTDAFQWKRSVNPVVLVKLHPGLLWMWFVTAVTGAKSLLVFE